jgi:hypothetical protein
MWYRGLIRFPGPLVGVPAQELIALTGGFFQPRAVYDPYRSTDIANQAGLLQNAGSHGHAGSPRPQHMGDEFLRYRDQVALRSVVAHEKPPSQSSLNFMQAIAAGYLGALHCPDVAILLYSPL